MEEQSSQNTLSHQLFYFPLTCVVKLWGFFIFPNMKMNRQPRYSYGLTSLSVIPFLKSWTWKYMLSRIRKQGKRNGPKNLNARRKNENCKFKYQVH